MVISSLHCYRCDNLIIVDYIVTSDSVPAISTICPPVNATRCGVWFEMLLNINTTVIGVEAEFRQSFNDNPQDTVRVDILLTQPAENMPGSLAHTVDYRCSSNDKCNDDSVVKKLLRSIVIKDQFQQELSPLLKTVPSFDPKAAECKNFTNATFPCLPAVFDSCKRCEITVAQSLSNDQVCATCNPNAFDVNSAERTQTFSLNNRTLDSDFAVLNCQLHGCNSFENSNRIYQASKITFNSTEFFS